MAYYASERSTGESWISGIQLHIGKSFIPPPKVTAPLRCDFGNPSDILFMEYDFSLEEHVVSWSENDRKQKELIAAEREARLQAREARLRATAASEQATHSDGEVDDPATTTVVTNGQPSRNRNMNATVQTTIPQFTPVSVAATSQSLSGILTPTLVKPETKSQDKKHALSINLADFEREDDPFENVEMKTINDMEVLHTVLQTTTVSLQNGQRPACVGNGIYANSGSHESFSSYQNNRGVPRQSFPQTTALPKIPTRQFAVQAQQCMPTLQGVNTVSSCRAQPINALSACRTQPVVASSPITVLQSRGTQPVNALSACRTQPLNTPSAFRTQPTPNSFPQPQSQTFGSPQASVKMFSTGAVRYAAVSDGTSSASCALKGSLSSSDISNDSLHRVMPTPPTYTPPPYPTTRVQTPPLLPSRVQTQSLYQQPTKTTRRQVDLNNGTTIANSTLGKLPNSNTILINRVTDMGFHRHRVEKAIQILGEDDKQVIDYLCLQDRLVKKGFKMNDIEASLALLKNNEDEASHYLQLLNRFREFGFAEDKIKEALVTSDLDEDKAIDCLTGM